MMFTKLRYELQQLINNTRYVICYIRKNKKLLCAINEYVKDLPVKNSKNLNEKAYWFLHNIISYPKCQCNGCTNNVAFRGLKHGYASTCCSRHAAIMSRPKAVATNIKKYGSTTPLQNKEIRKNINQHNIEKYGNKNIVESTYFKTKSIQTCREHFSVDYPMQSKDIQQKSKKSCKEKYGVEYVLQNDYARTKGKITSQKIYGTEFPIQSDVVKEKARQTCQRKYGVDSPAQCPEIRRKQQTKCTYNKISFDSIYEIAYYIWLTDHNVNFIYEPKIKIKYQYNSKIHWYMPDFMVNNELVEIKGDQFFKEDGTMQNPFDHALDELYEAKHQCMILNNVKIIKVSEMNDIMKYICNKYGNNYLKQFRNK